MSEIIKQIKGLPYQFGGEEHTGWLPAGAAVPLPTPVRKVLLDLEIQSEDSGYLLCFSVQNGSEYGDTWHQSITDAEQAAMEQFGVKPSQWQTK